MSKNLFLDFEDDVMRCIIKENKQIEEELLLQYNSAKVLRREFTGCGFYTTFEVEARLKLSNVENDIIGNVQAKINDLIRGAGFVLYIRNGVITLLECYTYDEPFPNTITNYTISII